MIESRAGSYRPVKVALSQQPDHKMAGGNRPY
ncbi:hypothetical protein K227x_64680 [Rubripirellula lacrimiformis]|uniref:Uncharacterized protein n=1 Tax=Rubripirellula lacrimiformis TaxID=1930273 RepID=A0A517NLN2_9BACT|nr:hypothetical protein K227x_64680 [Rubripirellula lacrimiformis]